MRIKFSILLSSTFFVSIIASGQNKITGLLKIKQDQSRFDSSTRELGKLFDYAVEQVKKDTSPYMDRVRTYLLSMPDVKNFSNRKKDKLVSDFAFRKLIKKNFYNLIVGNDDVSKIGKYATLDLSDKPAFSFSPFVLESDTNKRRFEHIFSLNISGKTDAAGIFKVKDYRDLKAGVSWKFISPTTNYKPTGRPESLNKYKHMLAAVIHELADSYEEKFKKIDNSTYLSDKEKKEEKGKLKNRLIDEYTDAEVVAAEDFWANKNFIWLSWDINFYGRDKVDYIAKSSLSTGNYETKNKTLFTPGTLLGLNYYTVTKNEHSLLLTISAGIQVRHNLSEVYEPTDFQTYNRINDSVSLVKGTESVFVTDFSDIDSKAVFDFGIRTVGIIRISESSIVNKAGLSLSFSKKGLVGIEKSATLFRTELGVVIPFLNSKGESNFNLEIFKRWDTYSNFPNTNSNFLGVRFNVPISN